MRLALIAIVLSVVGILTTIGYVVWADSKQPNITLIKNEWQCTKSKQITRIQQIGGSFVPVITDTCYEYKRVSE